MNTFYVGLAASFHDPAVAIVDPAGRVVFAEAAERYLQDKRAFNAPPDHLLRMPELIREYCDPDAQIVAAITWSGQLLSQLRRSMLGELGPLPLVLSPIMDYFVRRLDDHVWPNPNIVALRNMMLSSMIQAATNLTSSRTLKRAALVRRYDHHLTHAANACFTSPFDEALCAVIDAYGEAGSSAIYSYRGGALERIRDRRSRRGNVASLGIFYSQLCALCGFDPLKGEEWKVMGLAPYGKVDPDLRRLLQSMPSLDGLVETAEPKRARREALNELRRRQRKPGTSPLEAADLACTGQVVYSAALSRLLCKLHALGGSSNLALSGGCALNSSYNGAILSNTPFERLFVPSAPADDGNAIGAALLAYREDHPVASTTREALTPYLGTEVSRRSLEQLVEFCPLPKVRRLPDTITSETARLLADGKIVGWMQGRAEFGPRALGHRSILADPRAPDMKDRLNQRVKFREEFRPFAPSILHEFGDEYFEHYQESLYMERTLVFRPEVRARVPAVVHVDGTGRLQTVKREWSPRFHRLLSDFFDLTQVPVLLNTSFNVMGKPIIHSVEDACAIFMTSGLDALVIDDVLVEKELRPEA